MKRREELGAWWGGPQRAETPHVGWAGQARGRYPRRPEICSAVSATASPRGSSIGWCLAHTLATGRPHPLTAPFTLDRFITGALVDEHAAAAAH